uniref:Uncharacterized protein n=1 Tax=Manihot esculenta TaxID=3983 RepID=A0A2C9TZW7_MANES
MQVFSDELGIITVSPISLVSKGIVIHGYCFLLSGVVHLHRK